MKERESGIELLRILAACFVVVLHYIHPDMGGAKVVATGVNHYILEILTSFCCCAVNIFVLISGYFLINRQKRTLGKPFSLYLMLILIHQFAFFTNCVIGRKPFELGVLFQQLLPTNYFVTLYIVLYFISPLINKLLETFEKDAYVKVLLILFCIFSIYPSVVDVLRELTGNELEGTSTLGVWGSQYGYTIVNFVLLYILGGFLRRFGFPQWLDSNWRMFMFTCVLIIFFWRIGVSHLHNMGMSSATSYLNPFVILLGVCFFRAFKNMSFKSHIINEFAGAAFTCYLFHLMIISRISVRHYASMGSIYMILHLISSVIVIYLISYFIQKLYNWVTSPIIKRMDCYSISFDSQTSLVMKDE